MTVLLVVAGAFLLLLGARGKAAATLAGSDVPNAAPSTVDPGNITRADQLIGTLPGGGTVSNSDLRSLDGFHQWRDRFDREIYFLCDTRYRLVSPVLAKAIMAQESSFNPNAVREEPRINDKSIGLMQLLTETARWLGGGAYRSMTTKQIEEKLYEPLTNISFGLKYLTYQIGRYGRASEDDLKKVMAAYNAGSAKYDANGRFVNHAYVASILGRMKVYANDFPPLRTK